MMISYYSVILNYKVKNNYYIHTLQRARATNTKTLTFYVHHAIMYYVYTQQLSITIDQSVVLILNKTFHTSNTTKHSQTKTLVQDSGLSARNSVREG